MILYNVKNGTSPRNPSLHHRQRIPRLPDHEILNDINIAIPFRNSSRQDRRRRMLRRWTLRRSPLSSLTSPPPRRANRPNALLLPPSLPLHAVLPVATPSGY